MRGEAAVNLAMLLGLLVLSGCATVPTTTTVTTKTVECVDQEDGSDDLGDESTQECTTVREETTVSHRPPQCHGVLSCGFYVAGEAIALPFRALGVVLDVVF